MLPKVEFQPAKHGNLVAGFTCGDEPWAVEVSDWIKAPATTLESASRMVERGIVDKVWLFFDDNGEMIGFSSLQKDNWELPDKRKIPILYLPYIAISVAYQRKKDIIRNKSYFKIIFEDFLYEARRRATLQRDTLCLHVRQDNEKAIGIYKSYGFRIESDEGIYHRMVVDILIDYSTISERTAGIKATPSEPPPVSEEAVKPGAGEVDCPL